MIQLANQKKMKKPIDSIKGILFILLSCFLLAMIDTNSKYLIKSLGQIDKFQLAFMTSLSGMLFLLPIAIKKKFKMHRKSNILDFLRAFISSVATIAIFHSFGELPVSFASAITTMNPITTTLLAILILKERVEIKIYIALIVGLLGVMIIVQPSDYSHSIHTLILIFGVLCWSIIDIISKIMSKILLEKKIFGVQTFYHMMYKTFFCTSLMLIYSEVPTNCDLFTLSLSSFNGVIYVLQILTYIYAFSLTHLHILTPFYGMTMVFATMMAYIIFGEIITEYTVYGVIIILAASTFISYQEYKNRK